MLILKTAVKADANGAAVQKLKGFVTIHPEWGVTVLRRCFAHKSMSENVFLDIPLSGMSIFG
jgi:hypothetical protein